MPVIAQQISIQHVTNALQGPVTVNLNMQGFTDANGDRWRITLLPSGYDEVC